MAISFINLKSMCTLIIKTEPCAAQYNLILSSFLTEITFRLKVMPLLETKTYSKKLWGFMTVK